jgi:hypothetical protein
MVVETDDKNLFIKSLSLKANYQLILTEECFLLLEMVETGVGKIAFWSSLFAINYLQLNKLNKLISLYFYDAEKELEYQLKLKVDNILLLRDSLVKKMRNLRVKVETQKIIKGQQQMKRLTEKEINEMTITDKEKNINELRERIIKGEINDYTVNTFTKLCGMAIEHFSVIEDDKYMIYTKMMKEILALEKVNKLIIDDEKELKENAKI